MASDNLPPVEVHITADTSRYEDAVHTLARAALHARLTHAIRTAPGLSVTATKAADAVLPIVEEATKEAAQLRRQVQGYKGMKDIYLRERNTAQTELLQAEQIIKGLCDAIDRVQALPPSPLPSGEQPLPVGYREGWETALAAVHSSLHPPKETP